MSRLPPLLQLAVAVAPASENLLWGSTTKTLLLRSPTSEQPLASRSASAQSMARPTCWRKPSERSACEAQTRLMSASPNLAHDAVAKLAERRLHTLG